MNESNASLANVVTKKTYSNAPCLIGEFVGFKNLDDGRESIIVKKLDNNLKACGLMVVTQSKAPTEELELRRNSISSFRNPNSKHHIKEGAILIFDQVKFGQSADTAEAMFIREIHSGKSTELKGVIIATARPLPPRRGREEAWVEILLKDNKKEVSSSREFGLALVESWKTSLFYAKANGITEVSKALIIVTDNDNSKPVPIFIKNVPVDPNASVHQYRYPRVEELMKQFAEDQNIASISRLLDSNAGKVKINVIPATRVLVPKSKAQDKKYINSIKNHTGKFRVNMGDSQGIIEQESIGYKEVVIELWSGVVNTLTPLKYQKPTLNEQEATAALGAVNSVTRPNMSEEKSKLDTAADAAAAAMAALAGGAQSASQQLHQSHSLEESYNSDATGNHPEEGKSEVEDFFSFEEVAPEDRMISQEYFGAREEQEGDGDSAVAVFNSMNIDN